MDDLPPSAEAAHAPAAAHGVGHDAHDDHGHEHHELGFWRTYIFSTDHKTIGIQYLLAGLVLMFFGFSLMMLMRWQLAYPGTPCTWANLSAELGYRFHEMVYAMGLGQMPSEPSPIAADPAHPPLLQLICGKEQMPGGVMTPDFYNTLGAMHGTIMVFFAIVPIGFAAFGNFVMPLQCGTIDMAFPRLNMGSVILFFISALIMLVSFAVPGGAAKSGWYSYTPLASIADQPTNAVLFGHNLHFMWPMWATASRSGSSAWRSTSRPRCSPRSTSSPPSSSSAPRGCSGCACPSSSGPSLSPPSCSCSPSLRWKPPPSCS